MTKKVKFRDFPVFEGTCTKGVFEKLCVQWVNLEFTKVGCGEKNTFSICQGDFKNRKNPSFCKNANPRGDFNICVSSRGREIFMKNDVFLMSFVSRLSQGVFEKCLKSKFSQEQKSSKRAKKNLREYSKKPVFFGICQGDFRLKCVQRVFLTKRFLNSIHVIS